MTAHNFSAATSGQNITTLFNSVTIPSGNHPENHNLQATPKLRRKATRVCVTLMSVVQRLSNLFVLQTNFTDLSVKLETVQSLEGFTWQPGWEFKGQKNTTDS